MASFRFVHTADLHLDSPLKSLALRNPELAALVGNATRRAFTRIVDLCLDEHVDALLIAGDLYDGEQTSMKTARFLAEELGRLDQAGIGSFIIRGNHDNLSKLTKELQLPPSVLRFEGRAAAVAVARPEGGRPVHIHGLSFSEAQAPESLLPKYKPPIEGAINIGLMHTSLGGAPGHDPYAPCSVADLDGSGFTYWALGHIHSRAVNRGRAAIVMPGMPQGRDINESGPKGVSLVTIGDDGAVTIEERQTGLAQFERLAIDAGGIDTWDDLVRHAQREIERMRGGIASSHGVLRVAFTGEAPLAWQMRRDLDVMATELETHAARVGALWIESVEIRCRPPGVVRDGQTPVLEIRDLLFNEVLGSDAFVGEAKTLANEFLKQLPPDLRRLLGADEEAEAATVAALAAEGAEDIVARLQGAPRAETA